MDIPPRPTLNSSLAVAYDRISRDFMNTTKKLIECDKVEKEHQKKLQRNNDSTNVPQEIYLEKKELLSRGRDLLELLKTISRMGNSEE